jgi:hypothetical protein
VINADRAGFLQHLAIMMAAHEQAASSAGTVRGARYERGIADGLKLAARAVEAWAEADAAARLIAALDGQPVTHTDAFVHELLAELTGGTGLTVKDGVWRKLDAHGNIERA